MIEIRRILALVGIIVITAAFVTRDRAPAGERHLRLLKSEPAADATLDAPPGSVELWFSEAPEVKVTTIRLTAAGTTHKLEKVVADPEDGKHIVATVDSTGAAGAWVVSWRTMSKDGHVVNGEIAFRVREVH